MFVHPRQFAETVALANKKDLKFDTQHVIVAESLIWNVTSGVFATLRLRPKARAELGCLGRPSAKASSSNVPPGLEAASEEDDWRRCERTRWERIAAGKRSADYTIAMERWSQCGGGNPARRRPRTPDPRDRTVSNRSWELGVQAWRSELGETATVPSPC